jgi:hypothetical protein
LVGSANALLFHRQRTPTLRAGVGPLIGVPVATDADPRSLILSQVGASVERTSYKVRVSPAEFSPGGHYPQ